MIGHQLLLKGLVGGLRKEGLLFQYRPDSHRLLKHGNARLQVHAEVNHFPVDSLSDVLLLLEHEHVVVEKLLQLLVAKVDAELLEAVELRDEDFSMKVVLNAHTNLENLESSDIQDADEDDLLHGRINEGLVAFLHEEAEHAIVKASGNASHRLGGLINVLEESTLDHIVNILWNYALY
jgi:hypothetical protein